MENVISLDDKRRERWVRQLEEARAMGRAAIFGIVGEVEAVILEFPYER